MILLATVLGAGLVFLVQPLVGKSLLPYQGGAPSAWATCLAFFQLALLAGYVQAYVIARDRRFLALVGLEAAAAMALLVHSAVTRGVPLVPAADPGAGPMALVFELARIAGLPIAILATATPLLAAAAAAGGRPPWRLFAASNAGSLCALLAFPFVLEPSCTLGALRWAWAAAFVLWLPLAALAAARGGWGRRTAEAGGRLEEASGAASVSPGGGAAASPGLTKDPARCGTAREALGWVGWSALGAGLLVATSQHLGQEIAVTPAVMVAPLAAYLAAFVVAFADTGWTRTLVQAAVPAAPVLVGLVATAMRRADDLSPALGAAIPLGALFAASLHAHGALSRSRPDPSRLEGFYLAIAAGGAGGGLAVALGAPWALPAALEFPALLLTWTWCVAVGVIRATPRGRTARTHPRWAVLALFAAAMSLASLVEDRANAALQARWVGADSRIPYLVAGAVVMLGLEVLRRLPRGASLRPDRPGWRIVAVAILLVVAHVVTVEPWIGFLREPRALSRSYFGTLRVIDRPIGGHPARMLYHGAVRHGLVRLDEESRDEPGSYYGRDAGLGRALAVRRNRAGGGALAIGAIGLGVGALAQLARPGDSVDFVEIDPRVRDLAEGEGGLFDVLARARARGVSVRVIIGDGRVELARRASGPYDLLVIDAFSGGVIPTHLLTREAFAVYAANLRDRSGQIVVHLSSQHFDLRPVVAGAARALGHATAYLAAEGDPTRGTDTSLWMAVAADAGVTDDPALRALDAELPEAVGGERTWTDEWSTLVGLGWRRGRDSGR